MGTYKTAQQLIVGGITSTIHGAHSQLHDVIL